MTAFFTTLPKAELHVHLEGTLEPEHLFRLAKRNNIQLEYPSPEACVAAYDFHDLPSFLKIYYAGMQVLRTEQDFYELAWNYFERVSRDNVVYAELFFDPQAHTSRGIDFSTIINGIHRAQVDAKNRLNIDSNLIMCFIRELSQESAMQHLEMAKLWKDWIIGVGLDSDEKGNPPIKFREVFAKARSWGFKLTMHCDVNQENSLEHIRQCLEIIQVDRIDHGVNALEDEELCEAIITRKTGLTVCPVSNRYVVQSTKAQEIRRMLQKGVLVTINSDDPAYFSAWLNDNFLVLEREGFSREEIIQLIKNSFLIAWISDTQKSKYMTLLMNQLTL